MHIIVNVFCLSAISAVIFMIGSLWGESKSFKQCYEKTEYRNFGIGDKKIIQLNWTEYSKLYKLEREEVRSRVDRYLDSLEVQS